MDDLYGYIAAFLAGKISWQHLQRLYYTIEASKHLYQITKSIIGGVRWVMVSATRIIRRYFASF